MNISSIFCFAKFIKFIKIFMGVCESKNITIFNIQFVVHKNCVIKLYTTFSIGVFGHDHIPSIIRRDEVDDDKYCPSCVRVIERPVSSLSLN